MREFEFDQKALNALVMNIDRRPNGCWMWDGPMSDSFHGIARYRGRVVSARNLSYVLLGHKTLPPKGNLRTRCGSRDCVNPEHLVPCTKWPDEGEVVGYCRKGLHKLTSDNLVRVSGRMTCKVCFTAGRSRRAKAYYLRKRIDPEWRKRHYRHVKGYRMRSRQHANTTKP